MTTQYITLSTNRHNRQYLTSGTHSYSRYYSTQSNNRYSTGYSSYCRRTPSYNHLSPRNTIRMKKSTVLLMMLISFIVGIAATATLSIMYIKKMDNSFSDNMTAMEYIHVNSTKELTNKVDTLENTVETLTNQNSELTNTLEFETEALSAVNEEYKTLDSQFTEYKESIGIELADLKNLTNKYEYIIDRVPRTSPLTLYNLAQIETLAKKYDINPHLVGAIFKIESDYDTTQVNNRSGATGLGQFIPGTGKYVYYDMLGYTKPYDHYVTAKDPKINIEMTFAYLNYLFNNNGNSVFKALVSYSGGSSSYADKVLDTMESFSGVNRYQKEYI